MTLNPTVIPMKQDGSLAMRNYMRGFKRFGGRKG